ncbi:hypothetical protein MPER_09341 [Moniliophthora perniciosa FA553]|nr:hypothetical protein MPER_09341 [Moniliophthora perniciosa FA553]
MIIPLIYCANSTSFNPRLKFITNGPYPKNVNVGSRVCLMDPSDSKYQIFNSKNQELTFEADISALPCGLNGALHFVEMDADGGNVEIAAMKWTSGKPILLLRLTLRHLPDKYQ